MSLNSTCVNNSKSFLFQNNFLLCFVCRFHCIDVKNIPFVFEHKKLNLFAETIHTVTCIKKYCLQHYFL